MKVKDGSLLLQPVHLGHPNALPSLPGDKTDTPSSPTQSGLPTCGSLLPLSLLDLRTMGVAKPGSCSR